MNFGEFVNGKAQQSLPLILASHEAELYQFENLSHVLCIKLLRFFAIALEVDVNVFPRESPLKKCRFIQKMAAKIGFVTVMPLTKGLLVVSFVSST